MGASLKTPKIAEDVHSPIAGVEAFGPEGFFDNPLPPFRLSVQHLYLVDIDAMITFKDVARHLRASDIHFLDCFDVFFLSSVVLSVSPMYDHSQLGLEQGMR